jgi:exosortase A
MSGEIAVAGASRNRTIKEQWVWHLGALGALLTLILVVFQYEVVNAVQVWWIYPTYSHCFLIIPISAWLIWGMRDELMAATPSLTPKALLAVPPILLVWLAAKFATINEVRQFAVVALVQVAILTMLGTRIYRRILFPVLFLFFLVPVGQYLIAPMQRFAAKFTDIGLTLLGVPHYTEGTLIELANGRYEIAEACAGLRFLIATMTLGVLFAHLTYRKWWKIGLFLVSCVVVPLVGNGLRCIGIIMLAHLTNNQVAVGADHLVYGWIFNMLILAVLFVIGVRFRDPEPEPQPIVGGGTRNVPHVAVLSLAAASALAMISGPAIAYWHEAQPIMVSQAAFTQPLAVDGWTNVAPASGWSPKFDKPDGQLATGLAPASSSEPQVDLVVDYYGRMREHHSLIASTNRLWDAHVWHLVETNAVTARLGRTQVRFNEAVITAPAEKRLVWSSYWMDGRFTNSALTIKLLQVTTVLTQNEGAALVVMSTPIEGAPEIARERLRLAAQALGNLPNRLTGAGETAHASRVARDAE